MCCCTIETSSVPPRKCSVIFGILRKMFGNVCLALETLLENLRKVFGNLRKIVKNVISMFI